MIEEAEEHDRYLYNLHLRWYGKRQADREAKARAARRAERAAEWEAELWTPGPPIRTPGRSGPRGG